MNQLGDSSLVDLIYDAIVDADSLLLLPEAIAAATGSQSSWVMGDLSFGVDAPGKPAISCVHGIDDDVVRSYEADEYLRDPWLEAGPRIGLGIAVSMARFVDETTFRASPIHNEFLRGRADVMHCMALAVPVDGRIIVYAMQRGARGRAYDEADEARLDVLRPHLVRLLRARQLRQKNGITSPTAFDALLVGSDPVFLCDEEARVVHLNVPAVDLIAQGSVFHKSSAGRLDSVRGGMDVHHAVRDAVCRGVPTLHVSTRDGRRWMMRVDAAPDGSRIAVLRVRDVVAHIKRQVDTATARFGFTGAEAKLAASLSAGLTIEEHALARDIKMPTARTQMSSLLAKSGCERQAQLISAVHEMPPARG